MTNTDNPFRHNYVFSGKDRKRHTFNRWQYPQLWFRPVYVQITEDGVVYYKTWNGMYFLYRIEDKS